MELHRENIKITVFILQAFVIIMGVKEVLPSEKQKS